MARNIERNEKDSADSSDFVEQIAEANTTYDVFRILKRIVQTHGYEKFIIFRLPNSAENTLSELAIITNWDPELIKAYDAMGLLSDSPVVRKLSESVLPFHWEIKKLNEGRQESERQDATELFSDFNFMNGIYMSVNDKDGCRGAFGVGGDRDKPSEAEMQQFVYLANHVFEKLTNIEQVPVREQAVLTERELECVFWTAAGKTSGEVGTILGISENTVTHYLSSASSKLNTVNKAHTVAKAMTLGLISP